MGTQYLHTQLQSELYIKIIPMGGCNSAQAIPPGNPTPQQVKIPQDFKLLSQQILSNFTIGKELSTMLDGISYTKSQATDLAKGLINGVLALEKLDPCEFQEGFKKIFDQECINLIKNGQISYYGILDKLKSANISQAIKSRAYHTIANIRKQVEVEESYTNDFGIKCKKNNDYKELTESELQQIVRFEAIADKSREIGQKIGFKFQSTKKQSQKMINLLTQCMKRHINIIDEMKYDLSETQVMKIAQISRQACNHYDNGVFILLVYLVQSCKRLQQQQKRPEQIQILLKKAISDISSQYPPGSGLSSEHQQLIKTLKQLQNPKNYNKIDFSHQEIKLTSSNAQKQQQVENIITKYALIAEECKESFEELVKATCLAKCVYFKIGLKYYPRKPNVKALTRIKEKMFFKKEFKDGKKVNGGNLKQVLEVEQSEYRNKIDEILEKTDKVQFKISDMVRGKCVFLDVADIIYSVNQIKKYVTQNPQFGIAEIESRFTNKMPISDVTLKIVLNNKIVAELQLTIQTNAATYNFAHKIYELQRTKVFSKLKIVHNYFQEFKEEFNQLAKSALDLEATKSLIPAPDVERIRLFFKMSLISISFSKVLQDIVHDSKQLNKLSISVDPRVQDLISVAFNIALGTWNKDIGRIINKALINQSLSLKLKSTILSIFLDKLHLPNESQNMQQFFIMQQEIEQKIYMQEYLRQYFQIHKAYKYIKQNQRLYNRAYQLQQIILCKLYQHNQIQLKNVAFVENIVIQEHCFQKINKLYELFNFYFATKKQGNSYYSQLSLYSKWLQTSLKTNKSNENSILKNQFEVLRAQYLIQANKLSQGLKYLQSSLKQFKIREEQQKVMKCQILMAECYIKSNKKTIQQYNDYYQKNVMQKAQILGLQLKGPHYADSLRRIQQYIWQNHKGNDKRIEILKSFTKRALQQLSRSKGKQFIYAINQRWKQYDANKLQRPQIKANNNLKYAQIGKIQPAQSQNLIKANWKNISTLNLFLSKIGALGCQNLSKANWNQITTLNLSSNNIGAAGCEHLIKGDWKNLTKLNLSSNKIGVEGCKHLIKADWKNISSLNLNLNDIGVAGCEQLTKANWKNITKLQLYANKIGSAGCQQLIKADWKNMSILQLDSNNIGDAGCEHLAKSDWKNLSTLQLQSNNIGATGCLHLSKANWTKLVSLNFSENSIGSKGCQNLTKADWKNMTSLNLNSNSIGANGCQHLSKANWKNITNLNLVNNSIGALGCQHLSKADWKSISILKLDLNNIGPAGCLNLSQANWTNIAKIYLRTNKIGVEGCQYLSKAYWKNISSLYLNQNDIGDGGFEHLSNANWRNLELLQLDKNNIGDKGCEYLSKANWKNIVSISLNSNSIGAVGCQYLSSADWKNIVSLYISSNNIGVEGCQNLGKADWRNLRSLNIRGNNILVQKSIVEKMFTQEDMYVFL